jgi:type IV secretion system protein VirB2
MAMKGAFGTAIACGAATLAGLFGADNVSGCLFF